MLQQQFLSICRKNVHSVKSGLLSFEMCLLSHKEARFEHVEPESHRSHWKPLCVEAPGSPPPDIHLWSYDPGERGALTFKADQRS